MDKELWILLFSASRKHLLFSFPSQRAVVFLALPCTSSDLSSIHTVLSSIHIYYRGVHSLHLSLFCFSSSTPPLYTFYKLQYIPSVSDCFSLWYRSLHLYLPFYHILNFPASSHFLFPIAGKGVAEFKSTKHNIQCKGS